MKRASNSLYCPSTSSLLKRAYQEGGHWFVLSGHSADACQANTTAHCGVAPFKYLQLERALFGGFSFQNATSVFGKNK